MADIKYTSLARHFDVINLPDLLLKFLPPGPLALADYGCGDGLFFNILCSKGYISKEKPVFAVDGQQERLDRVAKRFPFVITMLGNIESTPDIPSGSLDFVISTMVLEHVNDERRFIYEVSRVLKPEARMYLTTVYKKKWAWYFRKSNGKTILDQSHLREYSIINELKEILLNNGTFSAIEGLELKPLFFSLFDPLLFRLFKKFE